jgi:hypothetical protein
MKEAPGAPQASVRHAADSGEDLSDPLMTSILFRGKLDLRDTILIGVTRACV